MNAERTTSHHSAAKVGCPLQFR